MFATLAVISACLPMAVSAQNTLIGSRTGVSPSAAILPQDTYLHFSIPDVDEFNERFTSTTGAGLYTGDETAALREKFQAVWGQANGMAQQVLGFSADEILANADGELALAVTQAGGSPLSLVIIVGFDDQEIVDALVEKTETAYEQQGGEITRASTGGVEITTAAIPNADVDSEALSMNYFVADKKWVIGTNRAILEALVDNWDGTASRSLETNDIYADMLDKVDLGQNRAPAMIAFFDPIGLIKEVATLVSQIQPEMAMQAGMLPMFLPATGLEGLLGIMSATDFNTIGGDDGISKQFVMLDRPTRGILEVFALDSADQTPPSWVPANVGSYSSFKWKIDGAYDAIERLVDNTTGQPGKTAEFLDQIRDMPGGPGIHIKNDILDQLDGTIRTVAAPGETASLSDIGGRQLFAFGLNRTNNAEEVLDRLIESADGEVETRDFRGTTIYEIEMPNQMPDGTAVTKVAGFAIAQDSVVFGTDVTMVEDVIRGNVDQPLAGDADFQRASEGLPAETAALSYTNVGQSLDTIYEFLQSEELSDMIPDDGQTAMAKELLKDLPSFESIEKYFGLMIGHSVIDDDGLLTTQRYLSHE